MLRKYIGIQIEVDIGIELFFLNCKQLNYIRQTLGIIKFVKINFMFKL